MVDHTSGDSEQSGADGASTDEPSLGLGSSEESDLAVEVMG